VLVPGTEIHIENLTTGYARFGRKKVITRTSLHLQECSIVALLGPNGSGKTTLIRTLLGVLPPLAGMVRIAGLAPGEYRQQRGIGYLPESLQLPESWTGHGLLALTAVGSRANASAAIPAALTAACVDFDVRQSIKAMSKGRRQRLALALALIPMPSIIVLDEPEAGLDPAQRISLRAQLRRLASEGRIVIIASHDLTGLGAIADRSFVFIDQSLREVEPAELLDSDRVVTLFSTPS
jgi:ABC-type multidrug transport system ATPase subunit